MTPFEQFKEFFAQTLANIPEKVLSKLRAGLELLLARFRKFKQIQKELLERERQPKWHSVADYVKFKGIEGEVLTVPQAVSKTRLRQKLDCPSLFFEEEYQSIQRLREAYNIVDYGYRPPRNFRACNRGIFPSTKRLDAEN